MKLTSLKTGIMVLTACCLAACGMEPSGGNSGSSAATTNKTGQPSTTSTTATEEVSSEETTKNSSDAMPAGIAGLPEDLKIINTDEVTACQASGKVYDRRTVRCSTGVKLASSFTCDNTGITKAFNLTGFQIDEALKAAKNDGFSLDQCGETESGRRIAYFVRADPDNTYSLREIETKQNEK